MTAVIFNLKVQMANEKESSENQKQELLAKLARSDDGSKAMDDRLKRMKDEFENLRKMQEQATKETVRERTHSE